MGMPYHLPNGREFAALMHAMALDPLELVPSPPRTYPTNYLDNYSTVVRLRAHTHYWDGSPVE